jgi:hypothetical protein
LTAQPFPTFLVVLERALSRFINYRPDLEGIIIEREKDVFSRLPEIQLRNNTGSMPTACDSIEVARECFTGLLISHCSAPLETRLGRIICHIVIQERGNIGLNPKHLATLNHNFLVDEFVQDMKIGPHRVDSDN